MHRRFIRTGLLDPNGSGASPVDLPDVGEYDLGIGGQSSLSVPIPVQKEVHQDAPHLLGSKREIAHVAVSNQPDDPQPAQPRLGVDLPGEEVSDKAGTGSSGADHVFTLDQNTPCVGCGYNLRGLKTDGACPECATPIAISLPGEPTFVKKPKVDTPLRQETSCVQCGTVLRMQTTHGSCPNCLAPVWYSIYGTWLRASDPDWLKRVRSGVTLWFWLIIALLLLGCIGGIAGGIAVVVLSRGGQPNPGGVVSISLYVGAVMGLIAGILYLVIAERITTPNPATAGVEASNSLQQAIKGGIVIGLVGSLGSFLIPALELPRWVMAITSCSDLAPMLAQIGLIYYLRGFAARIPSPKRERSASIVMWGLGLSGGLMQLPNILSLLALDYDPFSTTIPPAPPAMAIPCASSVFGLATLAFTIWLLVLLSGIRSALSVAIQQVVADRAVNPC